MSKDRDENENQATSILTIAHRRVDYARPVVWVTNDLSLFDCVTTVWNLRDRCKDVGNIFDMTALTQHLNAKFDMNRIVKGTNGGLNYIQPNTHQHFSSEMTTPDQHCVVWRSYHTNCSRRYAWPG